jgi:hypothetical protein
MAESGWDAYWAAQRADIAYRQTTTDEMMTLSTGEVITRAEWERRVRQQADAAARYWETHPEEKAAMERRYIEAMQRDPKKD